MAAPIIPILIALGTTIAAAVPTADDKARRDRIAELQGRRLGLTDYEAERLMAQSLSPAQAAEREFMMRQGDIAATQGISGGQIFAQQQAGQERLLEERGKVSQRLITLDTQRAEEERKELDRLLGARGDRQREVATAIATGAADIATSAGAYAEDQAIETKEGVDNRYKGADQASQAAPTGEGSKLTAEQKQAEQAWQSWMQEAENEANKKFWATYGGGI